MTVYYEVKKSSEQQRGWLLVFLTGFIIGVLGVNFLYRKEQIQEGILSIYTLERLKYLEVDQNALFWYVLEERFTIFLLLALLSTTVFGVMVSYGYIAWLGASLGIFLTVIAMYWGFSGIVLFVACIFPHYLIYVPVFICFIKWCKEVFSLCYVRRQGTIGINKNQQILFLCSRFLVMLGCMFVGCLLEGYVNPGILHLLLQSR